MKNKSLYIIPLFLLFAALVNVPLKKNESKSESKEYFPINLKTTLVYQSSFGDSFTKYFQDGLFTVSSSEAEKFRYKQTMLIKDDGVYVQETYQYLKIFLFIKREATFTYNKPLLRFPLPLVPGKEWKWEGKEYSDGDSNFVSVSGHVINYEVIKTKAGVFDALRIESVIEGSGNAKNIVTEWFVENVGLIKAKIIIKGGGVMGFLRDILGYGTIEFELKEIRTL